MFYINNLIPAFNNKTLQIFKDNSLVSTNTQLLKTNYLKKF